MKKKKKYDTYFTVSFLLHANWFTHKTSIIHLFLLQRSTRQATHFVIISLLLITLLNLFRGCGNEMIGFNADGLHVIIHDKTHQLMACILRTNIYQLYKNQIQSLWLIGKITMRGTLLFKLVNMGDSAISAFVFLHGVYTV